MVADFKIQLEADSQRFEEAHLLFWQHHRKPVQKRVHEIFFCPGKNHAPDDILLIGVDMVKSRDILDKAYNDSKNVTAEFNRNILNAVNSIGRYNFDPDSSSMSHFIMKMDA